MEVLVVRLLALVFLASLVACAADEPVGNGQIGEEPTDTAVTDAIEYDCEDGVDDDEDGDVDCDDPDCAADAACMDSGR